MKFVEGRVGMADVGDMTPLASGPLDAERYAAAMAKDKPATRSR